MWRQETLMEHGRIISREPGLTVVELSGPPYEIGFAHGRLLAQEIALMRARLLTYLSSITYGIGGRALLWLFGMLSRIMERHTPYPLKEEIRGIADGSGQSYRFIFLMNALDDVLVNMACSSVSLWRGRTQDGNLIIGRNLDYPLFYDVLPGLTTVFRVSPEEGRRFISIGWPGFAAVVTGMNEDGLFVADLTSISKDRRLSGTPALLVNRIAIQGSSTLDGLENTYRHVRRTVGKNIMAASPDEARVLELTASEVVTRQADDGLLACTNHFESASLVKSQGSVKPPPRTDFPAEYYSYAFSKQRMDTLIDMLGGPDAVSVSDVAAALGTGPVANKSTIQSVVFVPASKKLMVGVRMATPVSGGRYRDLTGLL